MGALPRLRAEGEAEKDLDIPCLEKPLLVELMSRADTEPLRVLEAC